MPPEQAAGRIHAVGAAADIYALGAILYATLTGRPPFLSDNPVEVILQVLEREPTLPSHLNHAVPRELEAICLKCLEKRPADRYATAVDLGADLDRFLRREPPEARRPTLSQRIRRWVRRQPVLAAHLVGIAAPLGIAQLVFLLHPAAEWLYHAKVTGVMAVWLAVSGVFQWLMHRQRSQPWPLYAWLAADTAMLTALLSQLVAPLGMLGGSYLLLICCAGLAGKSRLVTFTAASALIAYLSLLLLRPDAAVPPHYALIAATTIVLCGIVVGYQVWRIEVLREYYDDRRGI
jgi:serine/threonine-protein kinase